MAEDRAPNLIWTDDGSPRSGRFGDVYFSQQDGLAETRAVFLEGCGLPGAWRDRRRFCVAELGFGTGLNIAALLDLWRREGPEGGRLSLLSIEGFPLTREEAGRALAAWPELAEAAQALLAAWPSATPGFHRLDLPGFNATLDLAIGDVSWALSQWKGRADAWFLDGFAPSTNPEMWSDAVLDGIAARSAPGARVATFTVAGAVRRGLAERAFVVDKRPGHGRKRERLEARLPEATETSERMPSVVVVGAGIAGAALARAFAALGVRATVIEADRPGAGGSGFPAALVTPRLDAGDAEIAALFAQALARAGAVYAAEAGAVIETGVLQLEQAPRDAARFVKLAAQPVWPEGGLTVLDGPACSERLGEPIDSGGLWMRDAMAVRPAAILESWLGDADRRTATVGRIEAEADGWRVLDAVGATHERGETAGRPTAHATARNLATVAARLPELASRIAAAGPGEARTAVRATTPDRLPLAGAVPGAEGLFILGGLGSRGFCAAPLLAEHVAAMALGAPSPLPAALAARIDPSRAAVAGPLVQPFASADG